MQPQNHKKITGFSDNSKSTVGFLKILCYTEKERACLLMIASPRRILTERAFRYSMRKTFQIDKKTKGLYEPGVRMEADGIRFTVTAPVGSQVSLLLYEKESKKLAAELPFSEHSGSLYSIKLLGLDWSAYLYNYKIQDQVQTDLFAHGITKSAESEETFGELHLEEFDWGKSKKPRIPYEQGIMYHLHVRNYTMHEKSGVAHRGTFLGLQEKIPYLKKLGVNQMILMPVYEFEEKEKAKEEPGKKGTPVKKVSDRYNYWGYKQGFYLAPKKNYAATENPVLELKNMVKAFHQHQMEVILEFYFSEETVLRDQIQILRYWMEEYQIDGFRIMGDTDLTRHLAGDPLFGDCKILSYYCGDLRESALQISQMAEMNDGFLNDMRRCLKGDEGMLEALAFRTRRNPSGYGIINYITGHDGFTLQDLVSYDQKHNEENGEQNRDGCQNNYSWNCGVEGDTRKRDITALRMKLKKNAMMMLLLSQGTPMILAGDEFGNSQNGNNNPYCLDNEVSWVDWGAYKRNQKFVSFVRSLIAFRKSEALLHRETEYSFADRKACGYPDLSYHSQKAWYGDFNYAKRQIGMLYCGNYVGEDHFLYVLYNLHPQSQELALPKLPEKMKWFRKIDTSLKDSVCVERKEIDKKEKMIEIPERTVVLLIGEQE